MKINAGKHSCTEKKKQANTEAIKYMLKNAEKYNMSYKKGRKKI